MKGEFKKLLPHFFSIIILFLFSCALFYPQFKGEKVVAGDSVSSVAKTKQINDHKERTGETSYWNPSQFSGTQANMLNLGKQNNFLGFIHHVFTLDTLVPVGMFFALGLAIYLSLCLLGVNKWLSLVLSIAYMLSLMFMTLLEAGHNKKVYTLTYIPLVISGVILLLRNNYFKGIIALLIGTSLAIYTGHVQMVYYLIIALIGFGIPLVVFAVLEKKVKSFSLGLAVAIIVAVLAAATNFAQLNTSNNFSKQTMRGGGILPKEEVAETKDDSGLSWQYAMSWSYEVQDFFNIIIPRVVGGGSQEMVDKENELAQLMIKNNAPVVDGKVAVPGYWSTMPFTSGGAYLGAGMFFLFIFSLFLHKKSLSFAFLSAFFVIFLLSLGENASWFNRLLFDNLPLFDKFRAPSSAISIIPAFIVLSAGLGINHLLDGENSKDRTKKLYISLGIAAGIVVLILIGGKMSFSFLSANDANYPFEIQKVLIDGRKALLQEDAIRSIGFILATAALCWILLMNKLKNQTVFFVGLAFILLLDALPIDRRHFTEDNFTNINKYNQQFQPRAVDAQITALEPNGRGFYRVLDLSVNTFNDAKPAYHHNQIGGYDPAKLQRYQDIIDYHISKNNFEVLNMLNMKYIISKEGQVQTNTQANGNAWFVNDVKYVSTDLDEIQELNNIENKSTAIINATDFGEEIIVGDGNGTITLSKYETDRLEYTFSSSSAQLVVFSEVWYGGNPDWEVRIDDEEGSLLRANYVLRALEVPAGEHTIVMEFKPTANGAMVSSISSILSILLIAFSIYALITGKTFPLAEKTNDEA